MEIEKFIELIETLEKDYVKQGITNATREKIEEALFILLADKYEFDWRGSLWDIELTVDEAKTILKDFNFDTFVQIIESEKEILPNKLLLNIKVRVKSKGLIWIIHRYDKDPFPSNPHAHQLDNNIKLDLSTGKCYKARKFVHKISENELKDIRNKAAKVFKGNLPPLLT